MSPFGTLAQSVAATSSLAESRRYCEQLTRQAAKNFYYGLKLLPEPKRSAMFALYAYMRLVDDIADQEDGRSLEQRLAQLEAWRVQTHAVVAGEKASEKGHPVWPAFAATAHRYGIPVHCLDAVIAGQQQDLHPVRFDTFDDLSQYCYRVAGVVGLASICIWGYDGGKQTETMAVDLGLAFQLTNILRDVREDALRGRCYLPHQELDRMHVTPEDLRRGPGGEAFLELMRFQIERAQSYYDKSRDLEFFVKRDSRPTLVAMTSIYHGLLNKISRRPQRVLSERVSLSLPSKLVIGWRALRSK